jgi:hypothetical protein
LTWLRNTVYSTLDETLDFRLRRLIYIDEIRNVKKHAYLDFEVFAKVNHLCGVCAPDHLPRFPAVLKQIKTSLKVVRKPNVDMLMHKGYVLKMCRGFPQDLAYINSIKRYSCSLCVRSSSL